MVLFAGKGKEVDIKRGKNSGLSGEIVGKSLTGKVKVRLDDGATRWGNSVVKIDKHKLGKSDK